MTDVLIRRKDKETQRSSYEDQGRDLSYAWGHQKLKEARKDSSLKLSGKVVLSPVSSCLCGQVSYDILLYILQLVYFGMCASYPFIAS